MRSSVTRLPSDDAVATSMHHLDELLPDLDDPKPQCFPQSVSDPPSYHTRAAGVLRYSREWDDHTILSPTPPLLEYPVQCEYCGKKAEPSLDLSSVQGLETSLLFCCAWWKQLCEMLAEQRWLIEESRDPRDTCPTSQPTKMKKEANRNEFVTDILSGIGDQSELALLKDFSIQLPDTQIFTPAPKVLSFRLSRYPDAECFTVESSSATEEDLEVKEEEQLALIPYTDHKPIQFGICHHQDWAEFVQKHYSKGTTFLTLFPDGSAQVFYPSGLLALVVVVTEESGRVCIVYDDCSDDTCDQPVRAVFQSDGRATCYHSNGNIWLILNASGGQCLDEEGARVRRWSWSRPGLTPIAHHPVFLSLNKTVGVRVLGREQVFVSVLSRGQQAKFSVGACCTQGECRTDEAVSGPTLLKEELFLLAARIRIHLTIQRTHQCLSTPSHPRRQRTARHPHLHAVTRRLLKVSADMTMSERDRAFIQGCLQDCL